MNTFSEVLLFTVLNLIGIRILFHDLDELSEFSGLQERSMTKIVAAFVLLNVFFLIFFGFDVLSGLVAVVFACLVPRIHVFRRRRVVLKRLRENILPFIDRILLFISAGDSLQQATRRSCHALESDVADVFEVLLFRQETRSSVVLSSDICRFLDLHGFLQQNNHQASHLLKRLRRNLQSEQEFQRKFKSSMANIQIQIYMLASLYILAAVGMSIYIEATRLRSFFALSLLLMVIGSVCLLFIRRSFRWTA